MKKYLHLSLSSPILQITDFRRLLLTRILVTMALQIQAVIIGWHIYALKHDPLLLGLIGLTEAIPAIFGSLIAGHIVDISRPLRVAQWAILALALNGLMIFSSVLPTLHFSEDLIVSVLFIGIFISGAARSFLSPSIFSLIPNIVPRNMLASASAFNSGTYQVAAIIGPALGGLIYGSFGSTAAFAAPAALVCFGFIGSLRLSTQIAEIKSTSKREPILQSIRSGLKFTFSHKVLLSTMTLDMFSVLFGGAVAVLPIFADQVFHVGASGLGVLRAAPSVGSVIVAAVLALWPLKKITGKQLLFVVSGFGVCTLLFAMTSNYTLALIFLALTGAFDGVSMVIRGTILQLFTPENMRGRVSAVSSVFITSSNEIGAFESGFAANALGLIPSVIFGAVMTLVVVGITWWKFPELAKTEIES